MYKLLGYDEVVNEIPDDMAKAIREYETGKISLETFLWYFQTNSKKEMPQGLDVINTWNSMLIGWQPGRLEMLSNLRKNYKIFLLSNTNDLHLQWVYRDLKNNHEIIDFDERFFDNTFYSHLIGLRKPELEIYEYVQEKTGILPSETIFIDDIKINLEKPQILGWKVYHHNPSDDIILVMSDILSLNQYNFEI
jgi:FMN phosphatase YigB (HAD superfamily)